MPLAPGSGGGNFGVGSEGPEPSSIGGPGSISMSVPERLTQYKLKESGPADGEEDTDGEGEGEGDAGAVASGEAMLAAARSASAVAVGQPAYNLLQYLSANVFNGRRGVLGTDNHNQSFAFSQLFAAVMRTTSPRFSPFYSLYSVRRHSEHCSTPLRDSCFSYPHVRPARARLTQELVELWLGVIQPCPSNAPGAGGAVVGCHPATPRYCRHSRVSAFVSTAASHPHLNWRLGACV
jgi:hypothetical protein